MTRSSMTPADLANVFAELGTLQAEVERRERAIGRKAQRLASGLAKQMKASRYPHLSQCSVELHTFDVDGEVCLISAYLYEEEGEYGRESGYRYAVLCGGEAAKRALETAELDPIDWDEPTLDRRVALATYADHMDFVERLPSYIGVIKRNFEARMKKAASGERVIQDARPQMSALSRRRKASAISHQAWR
jgi:hypothetical protein